MIGQKPGGRTKERAMPTYMYTAEVEFNAEFTSWSTKKHDFGHPKIFDSCLLIPLTRAFVLERRGYALFVALGSTI